MGIWRDLGYVFAGINIIAGFVLVGIGFGIMNQQTTERGLQSFGIFNQLGGFALLYGGIGTIIFGILLIWALIKSGQIENIDKNIKIIAQWAQLQQKGESSPQIDLEEEQKKLTADEKYLAELERKKKEKDEQDNK
jgi:hypothetical protein